MKKKIHLILSLSAVLALFFLTALPVLSPVVFTSASEKGAIRHEIYKKGYPYQSYFAILHKEEDDNEAGNLYYVNWFDWKDETGQTPQLCYSKKLPEGMYKVSCGTGP